MSGRSVIERHSLCHRVHCVARRPSTIPTADTIRPKRSPVTLDLLPSRCLFRRSSAQFPDNFKDIQVENALINYIRRLFVLPASVVMARRISIVVTSLRRTLFAATGYLDGEKNERAPRQQTEKRNDEEVMGKERAAERERGKKNRKTNWKVIIKGIYFSKIGPQSQSEVSLFGATYRLH